MARAAAAASARRPRVLVTGFGPFPGAPENPTEKLMEALAARPWVLPRDAELHLDVLPVDYKALPGRLVALGKECSPDIAVHFGLSAKARGFTLERLARNENRAEKPDNRGEIASGGPIRGGAGDLSSTLPLEAIELALVAKELPVFWSSDAGGYLCNYLFYLSCGHFCSGFVPSMSGFIHVPPRGEAPDRMNIESLAAGAVEIVETSCRIWTARLPE